MSTTHHTAIATGAAANAATFNDPLGDLDAAIVAEAVARALAIDVVDDRVSTLIFESETSSSETVDARGGYTVLSENISDKYLKTRLFLVDAAFEGLTAAGRFLTIQAALNAATPGTTILVAPGSYTENLTFGDAGVTLMGAGQPHFDGTDLVGGTILLGTIDCNGKVGARIEDLGLDIRAATGDDAITSGTASATAIYQEFRNLILIGKGSGTVGDRGHGILCQSGGGNVVRNCKFYSWYHGVALRCSNSIVADCYFKSCLSNSVIIKSDTGSENAWNNTVANCIIDGTASGTSYGGPVRIQSVHASYSTRYNTVANITAKNCGEAVVLIQQTAGTCANVMVSNVISYNGGDSAGRADFDVDTATDVHFTNCMSATRNNGYGFRNASGSRIRALNCSSDATGAGRSTGTFDLLDLGSGLGVDFARFQNLTFDDPSTAAVTIRRAHIIQGGGLASDGVAEDIFTLTWNSSPNSTSVAIDLLISTRNGTIAKIYHYQIIVQRPNSTTLVTAQEAIGTVGFATTGSGNSLAVTVDVATSNTAKVRVAGSGGTMAYAYQAQIVCSDVGAWTVINNAA